MRRGSSWRWGSDDFFFFRRKYDFSEKRWVQGSIIFLKKLIFLEKNIRNPSSLMVVSRRKGFLRVNPLERILWRYFLIKGSFRDPFSEKISFGDIHSQIKLYSEGKRVKKSMFQKERSLKMIPRKRIHRKWISLEFDLKSRLLWKGSFGVFCELIQCCWIFVLIFFCANSKITLCPARNNFSENYFLN